MIPKTVRLMRSMNYITEHRCEICDLGFVVTRDPIVAFAEDVRDKQGMSHTRDRKMRELYKEIEIEPSKMTTLRRGF